MSDAHLASDTRLTEIELTDEQRKRVLALYRESEGAYHDLFIACAHVIVLRDRVRELESLNATLERSNRRIREKYDRSYP